MKYIFRNGIVIECYYDNGIHLDTYELKEGEHWVTSKEDPKHRFVINENGEITKGLGGWRPNDKNDINKSKEELLEEYSKWECPKGENKNLTQYVVDKLGWHGKPEIVTKKEFNQLAKTNPLVYRGLKDTDDIKAVDMIKELKYGDKTRIAETGGYLGCGIYFTTREDKAKDYAYVDWKAKKQTTGDVVSCVIDKNKMKAITFEEMAEKYYDDRLNNWGDNSEFEENEFSGKDMAIVAMQHGYNTIIENFGDEQYYNVLDRSILITTK